MLNQRTNFLPLMMWLFPLSFFTFQFILRLWPGLMMQEIMLQFSIEAGSFGMLAAFYYYGYAGMQIPMALLLDKFGARCIVFGFALLCGLGALLFTYTTSFYLALLSRFLIGAGSAVGFLGVSKVVSEWFSSRQYSKMIGFSFSVGLLGAIYGGKPLTQWIKAYDGQHVGFALAFLSMAIGLGAYLVLRSPKKLEQSAENKLSLSHCSVLFSSWVIWALALANLLMVGALEGFADVWGVPYLMTAFDFSKADAALLISFIFVGMLFGGPMLAFFARKWGNYLVIGACGTGLACAFALLLSNTICSWWLLSALFFIVGLMCCYQVIVFAAGAELVAHRYLGITVAFLNCINMFGGSFFHTLIGKIMDLTWTGTYTDDGVKQYTLDSFQHALMVVPVCALCGTALLYVIQAKAKHRATEQAVYNSLSGA